MSVTLYTGGMCSGKTTTMLRDIRRHQIAKRRCVVVRHKCDGRFHETTGIRTHDDIEYTGFDIVWAESLASIPTCGVAVIGVDEGQFFEDILTVDTWANQGIHVVISALDGDYLRRPFGDIYRLIPLCERVTKLPSVCSYCGEDGCFTRKLSPSKDIRDVGGVDKYRAVCRKCYNAHHPPAEV